MVAGTLANFQHPTLKHNLTTLKALHHVAWLDETVHIEIQMPFVWNSAFEALKEQCSAELLRITGAKAIDWKLTHSIATLQRVKNQPGINGVKNIIAISSGKGGVGKSSTAVNLALALAAEGAKVGILDADIYGPSIPTMLGAEDQRPTSPDGTHMAPIMKFGLATNSIGYLVTDDNAMVWRGPMASKALMQMLQETLWPDLDYLVLDMPPGTGDIQLTLAQNIPVTGAVVVTTPQDIALIDAKKGIVMFEKVEVPVLGIVENMSMHIAATADTTSRFSVPARAARRNIIPSCWASCRCISPCAKTSTKGRRRWLRVRKASLPRPTASWQTASRRSFTGRGIFSEIAFRAV
jgi:ATP-binding protein involved in chromosome partitioning